jgi:hypothetical protein
MSLTLHPDGSSSKVDGFNSTNPKALIASMTPWRFAQCVRQFYQVFSDPRALKYREDQDQSFLVPPPWPGASDFLYVSTLLADAYQEAAQIMMDQKAFLECGFPKIIDILQQQANATILSVTLCTNFFGSRGTIKMIAQCDGKHPIGAIHPFKASAHGYENFTRAFDWMVTGVRRVPEGHPAPRCVKWIGPSGFRYTAPCL